MNVAIDLIITSPERFPSIKEIIEKAYINKSTFYYHFKNTDDLFREIEQKMMGDIGAKFIDLTNTGFTDRFFIPYLRLLKKNEALFRAIILQTKNVSTKNSFLDILYDPFSNLCVQKGIEDNKTIKQLFLYSQGGCYVCIKEWALNGFKESEEDVSRFLYECAFALLNGPGN